MVSIGMLCTFQTWGHVTGMYTLYSMLNYSLKENCFRNKIGDKLASSTVRDIKFLLATNHVACCYGNVLIASDMEI